MLAYIHEKCGQPAFLLTKFPDTYGKVVSADFLHLDGQPVQAQQSRCCDSCGHHIQALWADNIRTMI